MVGNSSIAYAPWDGNGCSGENGTIIQPAVFSLGSMSRLRVSHSDSFGEGFTDMDAEAGALYLAPLKPREANSLKENLLRSRSEVRIRGRMEVIVS